MDKDKSIYACLEEIKQREIEELKEKLMLCENHSYIFGGDGVFVCVHPDEGPYDMRIHMCSIEDDNIVLFGSVNGDARYGEKVNLHDIAYGNISFITESIPIRTFSQESFCISRLSREDLEQRGFDTSDIDDKTMQRIADKLGEDYCEQLFWISLDIIAEEGFNIPRKEGWSEDDDDDDDDE